MDNTKICNIPIFNKITKDDCCGCGVCANTCPLKIISMYPDDEGFLFPTAILSKCTNCENCMRYCPAINKENNKKLLMKTYAGYATDEEVVRASSSGGFFTILAKDFFTRYPQDGYVSAVVWDESFRFAYHICSNNISDISRMRGSKYVQSRKELIYLEIQDKLQLGNHVLFIGCPCEVTALKMFLDKVYENLILVDLVCKGSTSEKILCAFVDALKNSKKSSISDINMRYVGWKEWIPQWIKINFEDKSEFLKIFYTTEFGRGFFIMQRNACYNCHYSGKHRSSDITLGDFHGAIKTSEYYNANGTSIIIANTQKGDEYIRGISGSSFKLVGVKYDDVVKDNPCIVSPVQPHEKRNKFSALFLADGLHKAVKKTYPCKERIINRLSPQTSRLLYTISQQIKAYIYRKKQERQNHE